MRKPKLYEDDLLDPYAIYYPKQKPLYRRVWFIVLVVVVLAPLAFAGGYWLKLKSEFGARAAQFDFSRLEEMEEASTIYDRNNNVLGRIYLENREVVSFDQFPMQLIQSVIAAEDNRFYQHRGVDVYGMVRAAIKNWRAGGIKQGASTLTQQLARNT